MGSFQTKDKSYASEKVVEALKTKVKLQKEEIKEIMCMRENESQAYEQEMMVFALKETEWKRERKRLKEEVKKLRKKIKEKEEDNPVVVGVKSEKEWQTWENSYLMEYMREERARRDEAVEKWKKLYLAIKNELDHLIKVTHQGERRTWIAEEEDLMDEMQRELKDKEETIELLQAQLTSMEKEKDRMEREVDILRQSLRIMSHKKMGKQAPNLPRSHRLKRREEK